MPTTKTTDRSERAQDSQRAQDKAVEDTFPASDPPARSGITGAEGAAQSRNAGSEEDEPKGSPTSDRHATETAHHRESDVKPPAHKPS